MNSSLQAKKLPRLWSLNYTFLILGNFSIYLGFQMLVPTFPIYIYQLGGSALSASLSFSLIAISALITRSFSGNAADVVGRRPLLIIGFCFLFFLNISFFFVATTGMILALRLFHGIGWGIASTMLATVISDNVPSLRRGEGTGYYSLSIILATSISAAIGIWLIKNYNFETTLFVSTTLILIGSVFSLKTLVTTISTNKTATKLSWSSLASSLFERKAVFPSFLCFIHSIIYSGIMSFIAIFGMEIQMDNIWVFFLCFVIMVVISRPYAGKLFDKRGHAVVILPGAIFMIIGLLFLSYTHSIYDLIIAAIFYGLGFGAVQPSLLAWAINRSPLARLGAANGTFLSFVDLGFALGTILLGFIATNTTYATMYRISALFMVLFLALYGYSLLKARTLNSHQQL
ncbi:MAG: major facilitator superfamily 1 [Firmicutes bacterium]|nr:major facilitator superfamily 1 [Bacillota bacterium]